MSRFGKKLGGGKGGRGSWSQWQRLNRNDRLYSGEALELVPGQGGLGRNLCAPRGDEAVTSAVARRATLLVLNQKRKFNYKWARQNIVIGPSRVKNRKLKLLLDQVAVHLIYRESWHNSESVASAGERELYLVLLHLSLSQ